MSSMYLILLRGINVGGKNKIAMAELKQHLEGLDCTDVRTYINSGNVIVRCNKSPDALARSVEKMLPERFKLDSRLVKTLVVPYEQLRQSIVDAPAGFGAQPNLYHSDVIFLIDVSVGQAIGVFNPREGVDSVWPGQAVIYSQRLSAERGRSRLSTIMTSPLYQQMTIRSWSTATKLLQLMDNALSPDDIVVR